MEEYDEINSLELELVNPETRKNVARLNELISDDFEEFGSSRKVYRKQDILNSLPFSDSVGYDLSGFTFKELSSDCVLVKYESVVSGLHARRSSIWVKKEGQWQMLHHQSTVIPSVS